jgi:signal transduction histidine kinase
VAAILIVAFTLFGAAILESVGTAAVFSTIISTVTPLLIGREMHERRQHVDELRERAELAEREREEEARRAVADERVRIARELHDVVAHQMSVMTLQADGARRVADGSDPRVIVALETIRETGHRGLEEMRRMVGLLRTQAESEPPTEPLPGLGDVEPLVAQVRGAGVPVDLMIDGQVRPLPESTELSAYRIIQESLTNAVQHGGPNVTTRVRVEYGESHLDIVVEDDGRGAAAVSGSSPGHGLVGMRERVAVLGGEFSANPKPGGGYRVRARIPVET